MTLELHPVSDPVPPLQDKAYIPEAATLFQQAKPKYTAISKSSHKKRRQLDSENLKLRLNNKYKANNEQQMDLMGPTAVANRWQMDDYGQNQQMHMSKQDKGSLRSPTGFALTERKNQMCTGQDKPVHEYRQVQFTPANLK